MNDTIVVSEFQFSGNDGTPPNSKLVVEWDGKKCAYELKSESYLPSDDCNGIDINHINQSSVEITIINMSSGANNISIGMDLNGTACSDTLNIEGNNLSVL